MPLSDELLSQFAKITKDDDTKKNENSTLRGTTVEYNGGTYVKLDGSDRLTPVLTTAKTKPGERVTVEIKNHTATVTGNLSSPSASSKDVDDISDQISEFEIVIADKVNTAELEAEIARIDNLTADNVTIKETLTATKADISDLESDNVTIKDTLSANKAIIDDLKVTKLDASVADITYATIENLEATNLDVRNLEADYGDFKELTTDTLTANEASIKDLEANKLSATDADLKYANIDFSNIGQAAMEHFYASSGLIKDVTIGDATITGKLVGVTISGELIEGGTIVAEKLVIKGSDGLYYKLNTDGTTVETEQTEYNSLNGQVITAKSITATKINVDDLVAFDATIGGFNITEGSLYSGVKESVNNTTRGVYLDKDGQVAFGDASNYLKYYKDKNGNYKLEISAESISISTSDKNLGDVIDDIQSGMDSLRDEITTLLRIESSRGTVFKNDNVATVLSVVIYHGTKRITDIVALKTEIGASSYLEWSWQRLNEDSFGVISADDKRLGNNGFTFTLSPEDVDTKVTFMCTLMV